MATKSYKQYLYQDARATDKEVYKPHRQIKCSLPEHESQEIILICTNQHCQLNRFLCPMCITQHQVCSSSLIVISNLVKDDVSIFDSRLSKEAREVLRYYAEDKKLFEDVDAFYDQLKDQLIAEVELARRDTLGYVDKLFKEKGSDLREIIDIVCSSFNYNAVRMLLKDMEQGKLSQEDGSRRLSLYITSKDKAQKMRDLNNLISRGSIPQRKLSLQQFEQEIKQIEEHIFSFKKKVIFFKGETLPTIKVKEPVAPELVDPPLLELTDLLKGRKTLTLKAKKFGLQPTAPLSEIEFPRDGYFLPRGKKAIYFSFTAITETLAEAILGSSLEEVRIEIDDKWLGVAELLLLVDLLKERRFLLLQIRVRSERIRAARQKELLARAGPFKLVFLT